MAASTIKLLTIVLFLALISEGYGKCLLSDISVSQSRTGVMVEGKPEWSVSITNKCSCAQTNVILNCTGFRSAEKIDHSILIVSLLPRFCLVKPGQTINRDEVVSFKYAWDNQFSLNPISSESLCP
ncbi:unnamed protein product [Sphenostylis stenocarpa]|uniref:Uncharacterized protein n=1 Tax=Sphenostylis stenocarpa TaxID=92480 RepID=A0AA86VXG0_9FABA|nr:unnamed protein product [Sphenostylis stenocarpa]